MPYIFESLWLIPSRSCLCFKDFNSQGIFNTVEVTLFLTPPYHQHSSPCAFFMLFVPVTRRSWSAAAAVQLCSCAAACTVSLCSLPPSADTERLTPRGPPPCAAWPPVLHLLCRCSLQSAALCVKKLKGRFQLETAA